jgi:peptide/nickel transport system substrate-binding protein
MKKKRTIAFLLVAALCVLSFAGCGTTTPSEASPGVSSPDAASGSAVPSEAGGDLIVATATEPLHTTTFYDPMSGDNDHIVLYNIYDTLFYKDVTDGSVKPWLAESWEFSEDGLQLKVKLREDVYFHNGEQMTAEDVKFTYDTTRTYPIGISLLINYKETEIVDDFNIIIHMSAPYNAILNALCSRAACVMDKSYFDEVGLEGYREAPIGTGAFKFVSKVSGDSIVLAKNEAYWGDVPAFEKVTIKTISDINTQVLALESGDVDVILGAPIENLTYLTSEDVAWDAKGSNASEFLSFNMQDTCWVNQDLNFRKAVQAAIDKDAVNAAVFGGEATIIDIYGSPAFTTRPAAGGYVTYEHSLDKAKEYLAASNYDGREFNVVTQAGTAMEKTAEVIQGTLYEIGINMKITAVDSATFFDTVSVTGDFDAQLVINTSSVLDMDSLYMYFAKERYQFENMAYTRGDEMDNLLEEQREDPDEAKRLANITQVVNIVNEDAYTVYILVDVNTIAFRNDLKGVTANMAKYYRFAEWSR